MEYFRMLFGIRASRSGSDHREMKRRIAAQPDGYATIGSGTKGLCGDLTGCNHRAHKVKRKGGSAIGESTGSVVTAPQGKVCTKGTRKSLKRISGYPCDYLAPLIIEKKEGSGSFCLF